MAEARRWREPTRAIRLRWGSYPERTAGGLLLIVSGGAAMAGADVYVLPLFWAGAAAHVAGWAIMPSDGWRRVVVIVPSVAATLALLGGPQFLAAIVVPYIGWLLVRHRPARSYPTLSFVLAGAVVLGGMFDDYADMPVALGIEFAVVVASAWTARLLHSSSLTPRA